MQLAPRDAAGEDDRPRAQDVAAVEVHVARRGVDPRDRSGDQDLRAQPARLLECPARELVTRDARREAEVVLDPRRRARLPAGRLALDDDRPQTFRGAVDGRRQAGRPGADDHRVVLRGGGLGRDAEQLGYAAQLRADDGLAVHEANRGVVALARQRPRPLLRVLRHVGLEPPEPDLVSVEEAPQLGAGGVPPVADHGRPVGSRLGHHALEAARAGDAVVRQDAHPLGRPPARHRRDGVVVVRLDPEEARRLSRPEPGRMGHSERHRHLPEDVAGPPFADHALFAVDELHHLDPTLEHAEERPLVPLVHRVLPGAERDVGRDTTEPLAVGRLEIREHLEPPDLLRGHHASCRLVERTAPAALEPRTRALTA